MYRGRHCDDRLFRPTRRLTALLAAVGSAALTERHLPPRTGPRLGVVTGLLLALLAAPMVAPVLPPGPGPVSADAAADRDVPFLATPPVRSGALAVATHPARSDPPVARPALPATGLMTAPPLPVMRGHAGRVLLFSFDDGPDPRWTPQVLSLLRRYGAQAVFCVVGQEAQEHPDLVRAIVAAGHELCNHTTHHDADVARKPGPAVRADLVTTQSILRTITGGIAPRYFRAPGGRWSPTLVAECRALGLEPLAWSADPRDWSSPGLRHIVDTVLREAEPGGVVVMHDGGGDRAQSVQALGYLLRRLDQLGFSFR